MIRSSILVREPCGRRVGREKKDATSTSRGKTTGTLVWEEATGGRGSRARAALPRRSTRGSS